MSLSKQNKDNDFIVKIYSCPIPFPFSFAVHTYIVFEHKSNSIRYEVDPIPTVTDPNKLFGHIQKNALLPEEGFCWFGRYSKSFSPRYKVKLVAEISGNADSDAGKLYSFMATGGLMTYPHKHIYRMVLGPNSNTFIQWILNRVPNSNLLLPRNAWGKGYKY